MSLRSKIVAYTDGSGAFWFLVSVLLCTMAFYMFSVNRTVVLVAERNDMESRITDLQTEIASMESLYIGESNAITKEVALSLGYGEASKTIYIPKKSVSFVARAGNF